MMQPIWDKRIVLPDGTVIMPEDVYCIDGLLTPHPLVYLRNDTSKYSTNIIFLDGARFDRCTYQSGVNDTTVYERDLLRDEWGNVWTVIWEHGQFILHTSTPELSDMYACNMYDLEVVGRVPYSEDSGQ